MFSSTLIVASSPPRTSRESRSAVVVGGRPNKRVGDKKDEDTTEDERRMAMPTRFGTGEFMVACSASVYLVVDWRSIRFGACEREFCAERWKWSQVSICLGVPSSILCPSMIILQLLSTKRLFSIGI